MILSAVTFVACLATWIAFSGKLDVFHVTLGIISSHLVVAFSRDLLFADKNQRLRSRLREGVGAVGYGVWLLGQIVKANVTVLKLALHPRCRDLIDPQTIRFDTKLKSDFAKVVLANSITLTPGTVTVRIDGSSLWVHALNRELADDCPGDMERRVMQVFDREGAE